MSESISNFPGEARTDRTPALLYEMIRSFVFLADTLNLSDAAKTLGSTRQTVRRHVIQLEELMSIELFTLEDRKYGLTEAGEEALPEARDILARGKIWAQGNTRHVDGMMRLSHEAPNGWSFYQQQQPLTQIWEGESALLQDTFAAWVRSKGELENPEFQAMRPYVLVYRDSPSGWICIELGEEAFYTKWFGWVSARSSIGRPLGKFPGGKEFESMLSYPFKEVQSNGGARIDEVVTQIPRQDGGEPIPLAYKRLLMASRFPDGSFALIAAINRSNFISIAGLDQSTLAMMPDDARVAY